MGDYRAEAAYMSNPVNITQYFNPPKETGMDVQYKYHTPIYALQSGMVLGSGYYAGGGVESVEVAPGASFYYQHLSDNLVHGGDHVTAGQLIGYSGGQLGYGDHPAVRPYSTGPHVEVGINAPYGGMWHPLGPNINPLPVVKAIGSGQGAGLDCSPQGILTAVKACNGDQTCIRNAILACGGSTDTNPLDQIGIAVNDIISGAADFGKRAGVVLLAMAMVAAGFWVLMRQTDYGADVSTQLQGRLGNLPLNARATTVYHRQRSIAADVNILNVGAGASAGTGAGTGAAGAGGAGAATAASPPAPAIKFPFPRRGGGKAPGMGPAGHHAATAAAFAGAPIGAGKFAGMGAGAGAGGAAAGGAGAGGARRAAGGSP